MAEASSSASPDHLLSDERGNQDWGDLDNSNVRVQDLYLPIAVICEVMKRALPAPKIAKDAKGKSTSRGPKIAKEAKETVQECVSEFISFVTSEACLICKNEKRKTISGEDVSWAMRNLGLDNYAEALTIYLHNYRESELRQKGWGLNKPGDQASGKKEGGASMSSGVQMSPHGAYGDGMPNMPAVYPGVQMDPCRVYGGGMPSTPAMSPRVQMGPDGAYGDGMPNMPAVSPGVQMGPGGVDGDWIPYNPAMSPGVQMGPVRVDGDGMTCMPAMSPGVQIGPGGVDGDWMSYRQPHRMQPDRYQMQMSHQMPGAPANQQLERSMAATEYVQPDRYQMQMSHQMQAAPGNQQLERSMAAPGNVQPDRYQMQISYQMPAAPGNQQLDWPMAAPENEQEETEQLEFVYNYAT